MKYTFIEGFDPAVVASDRNDINALNVDKIYNSKYIMISVNENYYDSLDKSTKIELINFSIRYLDEIYKLCNGDHFDKNLLNYMDNLVRINISFEERFTICKDLLIFIDIYRQQPPTYNNWLNIQIQVSNNLHKSLTKLISTFDENRINKLNSFVDKVDICLHGKDNQINSFPNDD